MTKKSEKLVKTRNKANLCKLARPNYRIHIWVKLLDYSLQLISLIPATAGGRQDIAMLQQLSQTAQVRIDELVQRTQEREEERKKKKKALSVDQTPSASRVYVPESDKKGQTTT